MKKTCIFTRLFALCITFCILFTSCTSTDKYRTSGTADQAKKHTELRSPSVDTESVFKNEFMELEFDKKTFTVNVKDVKENHLWTTLSKNDTANSYAFAVTLYTKNGIHIMNTQDNSVAFSAVSYENKDGILTVNYVLSDKAETAKKSYENITSEDVYAAFTVTYTMTEQTMYLDIDLSKAKCAPDSFISEITVMPCFGTSSTDSEDDYFLIPDGSGAIMHLHTSDALTDNVSVNVYGSDPFIGETEKTASSTVPVFGVKRAGSAFAAVITEGDALAKINANRATQNSPSQIYASFTITPVVETTTENTVVKGASYNGKIKTAYKFLSEDNANYTAMAAAAREEFINNGIMSSSKNPDNSDIPFYLTVIGEADRQQLTTTQQTLDILGILKGKGINNITLNYKGLLSGGYAQKDLYNARINSKLGSKDGFETLYEYTRKQGCQLFVSANIFSSSKGYIINNADAINGDKTGYTLINDMSYDENTSNRLVSRIGTAAANLGKEKANPSIYAVTPSYQMYLRSLDSLPDKFSTFLESDLGSIADGFSVYDAGSVLYSDAETDRESAKQIISKQTRAVSNYGALSVEGGNIYTVYNAQLISDMDFDTFYTESNNYEPVPFVQAILHGYTFYTGKAIDAGDPLYRYDMLRFIEYGALPSYEWIYSNENIFCYSGYLLAERVSEIVDFYNDATEIFSSLADETIIDHRKIQKDAEGKAISGIYCTTYSDGTEIYVNYTGSLVSTPENIAVGPYDYVAVKR